VDFQPALNLQDWEDILRIEKNKEGIRMGSRRIPTWRAVARELEADGSTACFLSWRRQRINSIERRHYCWDL
jgi:hypothetical protein